ncbi:MAG: ATP-binding protein [Janthinobacterium lividum]
MIRLRRGAGPDGGDTGAARRIAIWPRGLIGRVMLVLLGAMLLEFLGSTVLFERFELASASVSQAEHIAGQLSIAARVLSATEPRRRDAVAPLLSSADLRLDCTSGAPGGDAASRDVSQTGALSGGVVRTGASEAMRARLLDAEPALRGAGLVLGTASGRDVQGALRLSDGATLRFAAAGLLPPIPAFYNEVLSELTVAACVLAAAAMLVRTLGAPLRSLVQAADAIGHGPAIAVAVAGPNEVRRVARAFNAMQSRISGLLEERTRALAAVSHDLRTPVARLRLRCGLLPDAEVRAAFGEDLDEMQAMVESVLAYLGGETAHEAPRSVDLPAMLSTLVDDATDAGHDARYEGPEHAGVVLRPVGFKRGVSNLVNNAIAYGGQVRVRLLLDGGEMHVQVDDDGPGIPESEMERVMQPFQRLESSRNRSTGGVGLGLAIVGQSVRAEGGRLVLANRPGGGLRAQITIAAGRDPAIQAAQDRHAT